MEYKPKYSGPNRSGICVCGHSWEEHHRMMVVRQEYIDHTKEGYILGECEHYGSNELGGTMGYDHLDEDGCLVPHCYGYIDTMDLIHPAFPSNRRNLTLGLKEQENL